MLAGGIDHLAADTVALAVYAGHGNVDLLQWGNPDAANTCTLAPSNRMRLGMASGDIARLAIFVTSCTMNVPNLTSTVGASAAGQYLGWHNSPAVPDFVLQSFYDQTKVMVEGGTPLSNRLSWLGVGKTKPGLGYNSPVVFTEQGEDEEVQRRHFFARVSAGTGIDADIPASPSDKFRYTWLDYGDCP